MAAHAHTLTPARHERRQLRLRLLRGHVVFQTAQHVEKVTFSILAQGRIELERQPHLDTVVHEVEAGRHDANDLACETVDLDRLADDVLTCAEDRPPQLVRQDDERRTAGARLVTAEPAAVLRPNGERLEQLGIHAARVARRGRLRAERFTSPITKAPTTEKD